MAYRGKYRRVSDDAFSDAPMPVEEDYLLEHEGKPIHLVLGLDRHEYEAVITAFIDETLKAMHIAFDGAGLAVADLDEVLLVGGATRTPLVQRRIEEGFGIQPRGEVDPGLCVATGGAIQAAVIAGDQVSGVLVEVTPHTFGTSALSLLDGESYLYAYVPLIRKNTPIPVTKGEAFSTIEDGLKAIDADRIEALRDAVASGDATAIDQAMEVLSDLIFYLEF